MRNFAALMLVLGCLLIATGNVHATTLLPRNAHELATSADRVFVGQCVSAEQGQMRFPANHVSLTYTEYTFQIEHAIKGTTAPFVVLRQFGPARGLGSIVGMPYYESGKKYLLCLREDSEYGLSSPIGLGQGAFQVVGPPGQETAINAYGNLGLFARIDPSSPEVSTFSEEERDLLASSKGPVDFDTFVSMMEKLAQ